MTFSGLVAKNLLRQRTRTVLTLLGISLGIATVVALGVITEGLKSSSAEFVGSGGADFMVAQEGASDLTFSAVSEEEWRLIAERPDVARATGMLFEVADVGANPYFLLLGYPAEALPDERLGLLTGRLLAPGAANEVVLGAAGARELDAQVGHRVVLDREEFLVVGIFESGDRWRDSGAIAPLETVQRLASRRDVVTAVHVAVAEGRDPHLVATAIERDLPQLAAIEDTADYAEVDQGFEIMEAANLAISLLAVGIGAIGVMNTMIMSVFERTREIGILRAVGWRGRRILRMILLESLFLCLLAAAVGIGVGVLASRAVLLIPAASALLAPAYTAGVFGRALAVGVIVAVLGALYPAVRAVRLSPMEALRYE